MRKGMVERINQGHMGIKKSKGRTKDVLHWPGITCEISYKTSRCTICLDTPTTKMKKGQHTLLAYHSRLAK